MIPPAPFYKFAPETLLFNTSRAMDALLAFPPTWPDPAEPSMQVGGASIV
jgi:hypothetical protein